MTEERADLSPYSTSVAAGLSAHWTPGLGRPGFLADFSGDGSGGQRYVVADGEIVRYGGYRLDRLQESPHTFGPAVQTSGRQERVIVRH
jgi:hypothetical protein